MCVIVCESVGVRVCVCVRVGLRVYMCVFVCDPCNRLGNWEYQLASLNHSLGTALRLCLSLKFRSKVDA